MPATAVGLAALLAYYAVLFILSSVNKAIYPYPLEIGEGEVLNYAAILARGERLYAPLGGRSAVIVNYPPVVPALLAGFLDPAHPSLRPGRILTTISTLTAAALAVAVCLRRRVPWYLAPLPALLFITHPSVLPCANLIKVDLVALPLSFAGLATFLLVGGRRGALLAVPAFVLGLFAKHSVVFAPLAVAAYFLIHDRKGLLLFLTALLGLGGGALVIAEWLTQGEFLRHLLVYTYDGYNPARLGSYLLELLSGPMYVSGFLAAAALGLWIAWIRAGGPADPAWYYFPAAVLSLALLGKFGSSVFYFHEFVLAAALTVACSLGRLLGPEEAGPRPQAAALVVVLLLLLLYAGSHAYFRSDFIPRTQHVRDRMVKRLIERAPLPVFAEDVGLIVLAGKRPPYPNIYSLSAAIARKTWDPAPLLEDIANHALAFAYTESDLARPNTSTAARIHPQILAALREHYAPVAGREDLFIYFPKDALPAPDRRGGAPGR